MHPNPSQKNSPPDGGPPSALPTTSVSKPSVSPVGSPARSLTIQASTGFPPPADPYCRTEVRRAHHPGCTEATLPAMIILACLLNHRQQPSALAIPSIVVTSEPLALTASRMQNFALTPLHAPRMHLRLVSQPTCVPVSRKCSHRDSTRRVRLRPPSQRLCHSPS